jgi:hypothetical protein
MDDPLAEQLADTPPPPPDPPFPITLPSGGAISLKPAEFLPDANLFQGSTVYPNTAQTVIVTTEDRLRVYLHEYGRAANTRKSWIGPFGVLLTVITTLLTVTFSDQFGVKAAVWQAFFCFCLVGSIIWLIYDLYQMLSRRKSASIDWLIKKVKNLP